MGGCSSSSSSSLWGCGVWPVDVAEFLEVVETHHLLCHHDLTMASASCRCWRPLLLSGVYLPCYHSDQSRFHHRNMLECACRRGSVSLVSLLLSHDFRWDPSLFPLAVECAAESGSVECMRLLRSHGACPSGSTFTAAITSGSLPLMRLLIQEGCPPSDPLCDAAVSGRLEVLRYLREECGFTWDSQTICAHVARQGHLECLKYCVENGAPWSPELMPGRAEGLHGRLDVLQYLRDNGIPWTSRTCASLAGGGHLELLRKFHEELGVPWDDFTCRLAAECDQLGCLKYAREHGCPWDAKLMCMFALRGGSIQCLEYCVEHGCECSDPQIFREAAFRSLALVRFAHQRVFLSNLASCEVACTEAAKADRLDVLQYLRENGCSWDVYTTEAAARHPRVLKYCHQSGCPWDTRTCWAAAGDRSSASCLAYAHANGCPVDVTTLGEAAQLGSVVCLKYCHDLGLPWSSRTICAGAADSDCVGVLKYAFAHGCAWNEYVMPLALRAGSLSCFLFCLESGRPWDSAKINEHPTSRRWLKEGLIPATLLRK